MVLHKCIIKDAFTFRIKENGRETVIVKENGKIVSHTVDGQQVAIEGPSSSKKKSEFDWNACILLLL